MIPKLEKWHHIQMMPKLERWLDIQMIPKLERLLHIHSRAYKECTDRNEAETPCTHQNWRDKGKWTQRIDQARKKCRRSRFDRNSINYGKCASKYSKTLQPVEILES